MILKLYFDGGNAQKIGVWAVIGKAEQTIVAKLAGLVDYSLPQTNNQAEWSAFYHAVLYAFTQQEYYEQVVIMGDSELVVKQAQGHFAITSPHLKSLYEKSRKVLDKLQIPCKIMWIPREENGEADALGRTMRELDKGLKGR